MGGVGADGVSGVSGVTSKPYAARGLIGVLSPLVEDSWSDMLEGLHPFFVERRYNDNELIFRKGDNAHSIYFITQVTAGDRL